MANCSEDVRLTVGSRHHAVNIRKESLTSQVGTWGLFQTRGRRICSVLRSFSIVNEFVVAVIARGDQDLRSAFRRAR